MMFKLAMAAQKRWRKLDGTKLILGGRGCPLDVDDAFSFRSLKELATYLEQLN